MRNLKRVLSLTLASVMLLGMMVVGASATDFADDAEIVNAEAVEITAGLGLFAGSDGNFNPKGNVTRAQMATIIVKMLYGSEINADQYKGAGTFSDTVAFEGGWAEGYINLCANLGVVSGYGDGTFKPGNQVTTAEAATMIINALGIDAGSGTWPLTVMSKAEEMKLFDELSPKPGTNEALIRDQLASIVLQGIEYSPAGTTGYKLRIGSEDITFDKYSDAMSAALSVGKTAADIQKIDSGDSLASKTFGMQKATGILTENQATNADYAYTVVAGVNYNIETGLDKVGHKVTVYYKDEYKSEKEPGTTYAIIDECESYTVDTAITTEKDFKAKFGTKDLSPKAITGGVELTMFNGTYAVTAINPAAFPQYNFAAKTAAAGTYVVYDGNIISYRAPATVYATKVTRVSTVAGSESITLTTIGQLNNTEGDDHVNEYEGIAKDDIVLAVRAGDTYTLTKANKVEGKITRTGTATVDGVTRSYATVDGKNYYFFNDAVMAGLNVNYVAPGLTMPTNFDTTYSFYVNDKDEFVQYEAIEGQADLSNIVYVYHAYAVDSTDDYGTTVKKIYAQGVDMEGKIDSYLLATYKWDATAKAYVAAETAGDTSALAAANALGLTINVSTGALGAVTPGFYTFKKDNNSKLNAMGIVRPSAVATVYNSSNAPVYAQNTATVAGNTIDAKTTSIPTGDGAAYLTSATKFISVDGDGANMDATVTTGKLAYAFTTKNPTAPVLLSRNANGQRILEVAVIRQDPTAVQNDDYVYVPFAGHVGKVANGQEYNVYSKGEVKTITADTTVPMGNFYTYTVDNEGVYTLTPAAAAAFVTGTEFHTSYNGLLDVAAFTEDYDASNAIIVDARDGISDSDYATYKILGLDELVDMMNQDNKPYIVLDLHCDVTYKTVDVIYIKEITSRVASVAVAGATSVKAGSSATLTATCKPVAGTSTSGEVTWSSSDITIASVAETGATGTAVVTIAAGTPAGSTVVITATSVEGNVAGTITITTT